MLTDLPKSLAASLRARAGWLKRAVSRAGFHSARPALAEAITATPIDKPAGRHVSASYSNRFGTRAYRMYLPARNAGQQRPLVVMLHGCKQGPDDFAAGTRMNALADEHGFIVVYPEQPATANASRCWNWFQTADQHRERGEPSLIAGITRDVIARYDADPRRVYVAGLSAGGAMAEIMAHTYPDLYAAVGVHSGLPYAAAHDVASAFAAMRVGNPHPDPLCGETMRQPLPAIVFHGDDDTTVHPRNSERRFASATVVSGAESGRPYTRTIQAGKSGRPAMEHWLVHGAGHAWSGGSRNGSYADPLGPDASSEMLRFFLQAGR
jgi:poly(hydroxyalkanoate) depolymerase family esterase